jgi:hypothetical protein
MPEIQPLTRDTFIRFHGEPPPYRVQGYAIVDDGEPIMVGGLAVHSDWIEVWMDMRPEAARFPKLIFKVGKQVVSKAASYNMPAFAVADEDRETAPRYLSHLGFVQEGEIWSLQ